VNGHITVSIRSGLKTWGASDTGAFSGPEAVHPVVPAAPTHPEAYEGADGELRVGVVGYSATDFDEARGEALVREALDEATAGHDGPVAVVSGLTRLGVPGIAYDVAEERDADPEAPAHRTVGIACEKAADFECHDADATRIVGEEWGDESPAFLASIDALVRVGGGEQATAEARQARRFLGEDAVVERDLPSLAEAAAEGERTANER
jgi:hypothetical protein